MAEISKKGEGLGNMSLAKLPKYNYEYAIKDSAPASKYNEVKKQPEKKR